MDFYALDVETANNNYHSICQIGIVGFANGQPTEEHILWVDPQEPFLATNTGIHGISQEQISGHPCFTETHQILTELLLGQHVACHTSFDRIALGQACTKHELTEISCNWIDTATAIRRGWPQYAHRGYGLENLAKDHGIKFAHHNALEDAKTAGIIFCMLLSDTNTKPSDWTFNGHTETSISNRGNWKNYQPRIKKTASSDGPLSNHIFTFTGNLTMPRPEAAKLATDAGAGITTAPTRKTTHVVVGEQDLNIVGEDGKSGKQKKAEELIAKGVNLRIIGETEFIRIIQEAKNGDDELP